jgi:hypothetical protein
MNRRLRPGDYGYDWTTENYAMGGVSNYIGASSNYMGGSMGERRYGHMGDTHDEPTAIKMSWEEGGVAKTYDLQAQLPNKGLWKTDTYRRQAGISYGNI